MTDPTPPQPDPSNEAEQALSAAQQAIDKLVQEANEQSGDAGSASGPAPQPSAEAAPAPEAPAPEAPAPAAEPPAPAVAPTVAASTASTAPGAEPARNVDLPNFQQVLADVEASGLDMLQDVDLDVKIELGRTDMLVEDVLRLADGSVVELDKLAGDPVDIFVNERLVARGEVLVLNDNFCVRVSEIVGQKKTDISEPTDQGAKTAEVPSAEVAAAGSPQ